MNCGKQTANQKPRNFFLRSANQRIEKVGIYQIKKSSRFYVKFKRVHFGNQDQAREYGYPLQKFPAL